MNGTDTSIDERIRSFASAVRRHLDDLPEDELDEILGGLSADLADQAADNDGVLDLGDPAAYAAELRAAAGIPPRTEVARRRPMRQRLEAWRQGVAAGIRRSPFGGWTLDLLSALRPVWWVLRAFGVWAAVAGLIALLPPFPYGPYGRWAFPDSPLDWLSLLAFVIVSVQWGRGLWLPQNPLRHARTLASIVGLLMLPAVIGSVVFPQYEYIEGGDVYTPPGLLLDGVQINNLYAYDAEGNPIDRVQLFTAKGTPVNLYGQDGIGIEYRTQDDGFTATIPFRDYRGQEVWNIYPLDEADIDTTTGELRKETAAQPAPPFSKAPRIDAVEPTPTPTPAPSDPNPQPEETPVP